MLENDKEMLGVDIGVDTVIVVVEFTILYDSSVAPVTVIDEPLMMNSGAQLIYIIAVCACIAYILTLTVVLAPYIRDPYTVLILSREDWILVI